MQADSSTIGKFNKPSKHFHTYYAKCKPGLKFGLQQGFLFGDKFNLLNYRLKQISIFSTKKVIVLRWIAIVPISHFGNFYIKKSIKKVKKVLISATVCKTKFYVEAQCKFKTKHIKSFNAVEKTAYISSIIQYLTYILKRNQAAKIKQRILKNVQKN